MPYTVHHKISELIIKHLRGETTKEEKAELNAWTNSSPENKALYEELTTEQTLAKEVHNIDGIKSRIQKTIYQQLPQLAPVVPMFKRTAFKWIAAAAVIIIIATTAIVISKRSEKSPQQAIVAHDVPAPTNTRAVITLADGSKVYLDSASNGTIAQENNVSVVKNDKGEIVYNTVNASTLLSMTYNTLFNPRGSKVISLTLSDGTKVWLNSESSLRYPASFASSAVNRDVEITGEAYFEVQHNAKQPFKVHLPNGGVIEDIGTAFNVNSYTDEAAIKTTLIEGSVIVRSDPDSYRENVKLKPGEQAILSTTSHSLLTTSAVDLEQVTAWKNGLFSFKAADITTVMRQLQRWYDLDVIYSGIPTEKFHVEMDRNTNLSNVFRILEETGGVHFKIEGKTITVMK
jgi:ferric-dicitrate binding protein FerR (iron transport regulator)